MTVNVSQARLAHALLALIDHLDSDIISARRTIDNAAALKDGLAIIQAREWKSCSVRSLNELCCNIDLYAEHSKDAIRAALAAVAEDVSGDDTRGNGVPASGR